MSEVMTEQQCAASSLMDIVGLKFGPHRIAMYYQSAFKIAAAIQQSAKLAARHEGVRSNLWAEHVKSRLNRYHSDVPVNREYRRSKHRANFETWSVGFEKNLIWLKFDELTVRIHYENAFELYGWLRNEATNAKRWAGDRSRMWSTRAALTDAEENDKIVYVQ